MTPSDRDFERNWLRNHLGLSHGAVADGYRPGVQDGRRKEHEKGHRSHPLRPIANPLLNESAGEPDQNQEVKRPSDIGHPSPKPIEWRTYTQSDRRCTGNDIVFGKPGVWASATTGQAPLPGQGIET